MGLITYAVLTEYRQHRTSRQSAPVVGSPAETGGPSLMAENEPALPGAPPTGVEPPALPTRRYYYIDAQGRRWLIESYAHPHAGTAAEPVDQAAYRGDL